MTRKRTASIAAATATGLGILLATGLPADAARQITGADIKNGSITRKDVRKGSLTLDRLSGPTQRLILTNGAVGPTGPRGSTGPRGATGARGATGPRGATGSTGARGANGTNGVAGYQIVPNSSANDTAQTKTITIDCPAGKVVLGGGATAAGNDTAVLQSSNPDGNARWAARATIPGGAPASGWQLNGYAICATVAP